MFLPSLVLFAQKKEAAALKDYMNSKGFVTIHLKSQENDDLSKRSDHRVEGLESLAYLANFQDHNLWLLKTCDGDGPGKPFFIDMKSKKHQLKECMLIKAKPDKAEPSFRAKLIAELFGSYVTHKKIKGWHLFTRGSNSTGPSQELLNSLSIFPDCKIKTCGDYDLVVECGQPYLDDPEALPATHRSLTSEQMLKAIDNLIYNL